MNPLVSILCLTYNQEKYIREALDSFLKQEVDFNFEILVHDDASTDGTKEILKKYKKKYPDQIRVYYEDENRYSKDDFAFINDLFVNAHGKYIAMCEGDDFWTSNQKLQKQVAYMESNPDCAVSFHSTRVFYEDKSKPDYTLPKNSHGEFTVAELLKNNYIHTSSVMYRNQEDYQTLDPDVMPGDLYLHLYHASRSRIGFIPDEMSAYRRQPGGVWWESDDRMDNIFKKYPYQMANFYRHAVDMFRDDDMLVDIIDKHIRFLLEAYARIDSSEKLSLLQVVFTKLPELTEWFVTDRIQFISELQTENKRLSAVIDTKKAELKSIKSSRWYRLHPRRVLNRATKAKKDS